jgi:hypothetical protein
VDLEQFLLIVIQETFGYILKILYICYEKNNRFYHGFS